MSCEVEFSFLKNFQEDLIGGLIFLFYTYKILSFRELPASAASSSGAASGRPTPSKTAASPAGPR
jgi:hypothetical protein